jgi:hypothetical protein
MRVSGPFSLGSCFTQTMVEADEGPVECYSGHIYAQEPRAMVWQGARHEVTRVVERWRTPEGPAFWVHTDLGGQFELHYHELEDRWIIKDKEVQS